MKSEILSAHSRIEINSFEVRMRNENEMEDIHEILSSISKLTLEEGAIIANPNSNVIVRWFSFEWNQDVR